MLNTDARAVVVVVGAVVAVPSDAFAYEEPDDPTERSTFRSDCI